MPSPPYPAPINLTPSCFLGAPPTQTPNGPPASSLIQSTSFLDSVPVTLTLEPRDLLGVEESAGGPPAFRGGGGGGTLGAVAKDGRGGVKTVEVELRRRPGEGFGFVIASQEVANGSESQLTSEVSYLCDSCTSAISEIPEEFHRFQQSVYNICLPSLTGIISTLKQGWATSFSMLT